MTTLAVISGGLREPSSTRLLAGRIDTAVHKALAAIDMSATSTMIELRPLGRAIMDAMLTGVVAPELEKAFDAVASADGLIAVTQAFNASFSGLFKSFFDVLPEQTLWDMPVLIAATGGTERHSLVLDHALRPMFSYLHADRRTDRRLRRHRRLRRPKRVRSAQRANRHRSPRLRPPAELVRRSYPPRRLRGRADRNATPTRRRLPAQRHRNH